jgi:hypothetical protein
MKIKLPERSPPSSMRPATDRPVADGGGGGRAFGWREGGRSSTTQSPRRCPTSWHSSCRNVAKVIASCATRLLNYSPNAPDSASSGLMRFELPKRFPIRCQQRVLGSPTFSRSTILFGKGRSVRRRPLASSGFPIADGPLSTIFCHFACPIAHVVPESDQAE